MSGAFAVLLLGFPLGASPVTAASNPIQNPGAESGTGAANASDVFPPPSWTASTGFTAVQYGSSGSPDAGVSAAIGGGSNFFAGGPDNASSNAVQSIDVSGMASTIDTGSVEATISAYLGGYLGQEDRATIAVDFRNANATSLSEASIGPVTAAQRNSETTLVLRTTTVDVPVGTRSIRVTIQATRLTGTYNDGYADNVNLTLGGAQAALCPGVEGVGGNHIVGTSGADTLVGTADRDVICGLGGPDTLTGGGGNDLVQGGGATDVLRGQAGSDTLKGGLGNDRFKGGGGSDTLRGEEGNDVLWGGPGIDDCKGGPGTDHLNGCE